MSGALKYETYNIHLDKFTFTLNKDRNEIISGGDDMTIKLFDFASRTTKDIIDVSEEVMAISFGCGKLAYGQGSKLQMVDIDQSQSDSKFEVSSTILLTAFNSNVKKIVFNEKLNLLISFSEDDDIHIINLNSLDVFKYKSNHEGSLKNMRVSPKGEFLITTGCDGFMSIYEFNQEDVGKIQNKKRIKISQKLTLESAQSLDIDINEHNLCLIGGSILLKTIFLSTSFSADNFCVIPENSISHKDDINFVK